MCQVEPSEGVRCWHGGGTAGCAWACESRTYLSCCTLQSDCPPAFLSLQLDDAGAMEAAKQRRQEEIRARLAAGERSLGSAALRGQLLCSPCLLAAQHLRSRLLTALPCPALLPRAQPCVVGACLALKCPAADARSLTRCPSSHLTAHTSAGIGSAAAPDSAAVAVQQTAADYYTQEEMAKVTCTVSVVLLGVLTLAVR